jgi:hypothetical protein
LGDVGNLEADPFLGRSAASDAALRRRLSREIWRALADPGFAQALLNDPGGIIGTAGCTLRQHRGLASIHAATIRDFARQAELLFWAGGADETHRHDQLARAVGG